MDLETRVECIVHIMNSNPSELSSRDIASMYLESPTASDALTTGNILNVMALLGLVRKISYYKGKSPRYKFQRIQGKNIEYGIAKGN